MYTVYHDQHLTFSDNIIQYVLLKIRINSVLHSFSIKLQVYFKHFVNDSQYFQRFSKQ